MNNLSSEVILSVANNVVNTANSYVAHATYILGGLAIFVAVSSAIMTYLIYRSKKEIMDKTIREIKTKLEHNPDFANSIFEKLTKNEYFIKNITNSILKDADTQKAISNMVNDSVQEHINYDFKNETTSDLKTILENMSVAKYS